MISVKSMARALQEFYSPVAYRIKRYPKAAKKRRILKKWRNRFGPDPMETMRGVIFNENPFLKMLGDRNNDYSGATITLPSPQNRNVKTSN